MGVKQTKKSQKKAHNKKSVDDEIVKNQSKKTNDVTIWNDKKAIYLWGILPAVLLFLWTSTSTKSSDDIHKSPLEIVLEKVVEVGRETIFYDQYVPFEIVDRTIQAKRGIIKGSLIMDIPRGAQLWQTDALVDPFVRDHLFSARHSPSGKLVDHKAYLAAYLALTSNTTYTPNSMNKAHRAYLNYLPKEQNYESHPIFQSHEHLANTFGEHSMSYDLIRRLQLEWDSEYQAFVKMSPDFAAMVPRLEDYLVARVQVVSRSYSTQTSPQESDVVGSTSADLELYLRALNYDYAKDGFAVMVPILDALNHHMNNFNVEYKYNPDSRSFSIFATKDIAKGTELIINYGSKVDQWYVEISLSDCLSLSMSILVAEKSLSPGVV